MQAFAILRQSFHGGQGATLLCPFLHLTHAPRRAFFRQTLTLCELIQKPKGQGGQGRLKDGALQGLNLGVGWIRRIGLIRTIGGWGLGQLGTCV